MSKKLKLCCGSRCPRLIAQNKTFCKWHWGQLEDSHRTGILFARRLQDAAAAKLEAIKYLQGKQHEKDQQKQLASAGCPDHNQTGEAVSVG